MHAFWIFVFVFGAPPTVIKRQEKDNNCTESLITTRVIARLRNQYMLQNFYHKMIMQFHMKFQ